MNCKPGDLAVVVMGSGPEAALLGRIVRVTTVECHSGRYYWDYECPYLVNGDGRFVAQINDIALRPIRDPGDDAVDETLINREVTA